MNCNSNTSPLIKEGQEGSCNLGCEPRDIQVVCRDIVIPSGQSVLAIQGDVNSSYRYFLLPKVTAYGDDITGGIISVVVKRADNQIFEHIIENIEEKDSYIKIKWELGKEDTEVPGILQVMIKVVKKSEDEEISFVWQTFSANFTIEKSI